MVRTSNVALMVLIAFVVGFALGAIVIRKYRPCVNLPVVTVQRDTVTITDTIPGQVPEPVRVEVVRVDTVNLRIDPHSATIQPVDTGRGDTIRTPLEPVKDTPTTGQNGDIFIPISRKVYETPDYRAVVTGWRPSLDSMTVYRHTQTITNTETRYLASRWAVVGGAGVGMATDGKVRGFLGVSAGFVLWSR